MLNAVIIVFIVLIAFVAFQTDGYKGEGLNAVFQVMVSGIERIRHCVNPLNAMCIYIYTCICMKILPLSTTCIHVYIYMRNGAYNFCRLLLTLVSFCC